MLKSNSFLSDRQQIQVQKAIIEYLKSNGFVKSYEAFLLETGLDESEIGNDSILERKWSSIIRLQKQVFELEAMSTTTTSTNSTLTGATAEAGAAVKEIKMPNDEPRLVIAGHSRSVTCIAVHPLVSLIATGSDDCSIRLHDCQTASLQKNLLGHTMGVNDIQFSSRGYLASASNDMSIKLWDENNDWICIKTLNGHDHAVTCILIMDDLGQLVSGSRDGTIRVWDYTTGFCLSVLATQSEWIRRVVGSCSLQIVASCCNNHSIVIWNPIDWSVKGTMRGHEHVVESIMFCPQITNQWIDFLIGKTVPYNGIEYLISSSRDKTIKIWNILTFECVYSLEGHSGWVRAILLLADGRHLASVGDDKCIRMWDLKTGNQVSLISKCHTSFINSLALTQSCDIITVSADKLIKIWS